MTSTFDPILLWTEGQNELRPAENVTDEREKKRKKKKIGGGGKGGGGEREEERSFAASSEQEDAGKVNPTAWGRVLAPKR